MLPDKGTTPHLTPDQVEPLIQVGFEAAQKYPETTWSQLASQERNTIVERGIAKFGEVLNKYGDSGPSNR